MNRHTRTEIQIIANKTTAGITLSMTLTQRVMTLSFKNSCYNRNDSYDTNSSVPDVHDFILIV